MSRIGRTIKTLHAEQDIPVGSTNAPFMVKNKHGERNTSGVITLEFSAATGGTTFGNTLIVDASSELSKGNVTAIKDNAGNTWVQLNSITSTEPKECCLDLWMATNIAAKSPYKVEITISLTSAGPFTAEVVEYAGVFELDTIETVNTALTEEGFETTTTLTEKSFILTPVAKAICEKLKVGMGVTGGSIPNLSPSPLTPVTTIVSINAAKEEVKISAEPTVSEAGIVVTFGQAAIKAPALTPTSGDVTFVNYSGEITGPGALQASEIKPASSFWTLLPMTGFNTKGLAGHLFGSPTSLKVELPINTLPVAPLPYSLQIASFKFAPNNRGVVGTNATGELLGKVLGSTGKMDPATQTAIPSFVDVGPTAWVTMNVTEAKVEKPPAGTFQIRFEQTASSARIRGTAKVLSLQEIKEGEVFAIVPAAFKPPSTATLTVAVGAAATELNTMTKASINTAGEITLPKAITVKASEIIDFDGTYPLT